MRLFRTSGGAMGVCAIALLFIPGLAAPFRLVKWALWGAVLTAMAVRFAVDYRFTVDVIPRNRRVFYTAAGFVAWTMLVPWVSTFYTAAHTAGMLQMGMGFAFSWLAALELQTGGSHGRWQGLFMLGLGGSLLSIIVFLQAWGLTLPGFTTAQSREFMVMGTLGNPNWTAGFLLVLPPLLLGIRAYLSENNESRRLQSACMIMVIIIAGATVSTLSKAGTLALAAGLVAYILLDARITSQYRHRITAAILSVLVFIGTALFASGILQTLSWTRGRLFLWKASLLLMANNPLTGVGLGGFPPAYPQALPQLIGGDVLTYMPLHRIEFAYNDMLQFAVEAGIPAALFYLFLVFFLLRQACLAGDNLSRGVGAALAAITVYGCFDSPLQLPGTLALWWYLVGWMMAGILKIEILPENTEGQSSWFQITISICFVLLGLFQAVRFCGAEMFWTHASLFFEEKQIHKATINIKKAMDYNPENPLLLSEAAMIFLRNLDVHQSLETVNRALMTGFSFNDLFLRQKALGQIGQGVEVFREWQRMAEDYPGLFTPHLELGRTYLEKGDFARARYELETVLRIRQCSDSNKTYHREAERLIRLVPLESLE